MKSKLIFDSTIKDIEKDDRISFREKLETVKLFDSMGIDVIMFPNAKSEHTQVLISSIVPFIQNSCLAIDVDLDTRSVDKAIEALKNCKNSIINVCVPTSEIEMEYSSNIKFKNLSEKLKHLLDYINNKSLKVMITLKDLSRSDEKILISIAEVIKSSKVDVICFEENKGELQNDSMLKFIKGNMKIFNDLNELKFVIKCSDRYGLALSNSLCALNQNFDGVVTSINSKNSCSLASLIEYISEARNSVNLNISRETLISFSEEIDWFDDISLRHDTHVVAQSPNNFIEKQIQLEHDDDIDTVFEAIKNLGYEIDQIDNDQVYQEFKRISAKKTVGSKEIDAIVATTANQIPQTYKLVDFVINTSNLFATTASVSIELKGKVQNAISKGNGPLDAAFKAISLMVGYDYKLEDFQIQNLTKSIEAVGMAIIKLRYKGHSYSGKGVSTDIVSAGIRAYLNAINALIYKGQNN